MSPAKVDGSAQRQAPPRGPSALEAGQELEGYQLVRRLGVGGMGSVFLARHTKLGREVAIKILNQELVASDEFASRFLYEARIVNEVRHPNIVDVTDFIDKKEPRCIAYVMEFLPGPSLKALTNQSGALSVEASINICLQLSSALEAVHAIGVVHRDLKPENILVVGDSNGDFSETPSVKILDFGIAKSTEDQDVGHKTATGMMIGTPAFMAPEQIAAAAISPATDVYALGEIFFQLVSGRRVFSGKPVEILKQKLAGVAPNLTLPEDVPHADSIRAIVTQTLHEDASLRPSLKAFAAALLSIKAGVSYAAPQAEFDGTWARESPVSTFSGPTPGLGNKKLVYGLAAIGVALAVGSFAVLQTREPAPQSSPLPQPVTQVAAPAPVPLPKPALMQVERVTISSVPSGASVRLASNNELLGKTPLEVETGLKVTVSVAGHFKETVQVQNAPVDVRLQRLKRTKKRRARRNRQKPAAKAVTVKKPLVNEALAPKKKVAIPVKKKAMLEW